MLVFNGIHFGVFRLDLAGLTLFHDSLLDTFTSHVYSTIISNVSGMECEMDTY